MTAIHSNIILYTSDTSFECSILKMIFIESGIEYTSKVLDTNTNFMNFEPDFIKINPKMTVPVLLYDDQVITDFRNIIQFICDRSETLYPKDYKKDIDTMLDKLVKCRMNLFTQYYLHTQKEDIKLSVSNELVSLYNNKYNYPEYKELYEARYDYINNDSDYYKIISKGNIDQYKNDIEAEINNILYDISVNLQFTEGYAICDKFTVIDAYWSGLFARMYMCEMQDNIERRGSVDEYCKKLMARENYYNSYMIDSYSRWGWIVSKQRRKKKYGCWCLC